MPTNVSAEYSAQREKYEAATTLQQKIIELEKLISLAPSHKGAENLRRELRRQLAKLKAELAKKKAQEKQSSGAAKDEFSIKKEGAAQVCIVGATNSGKSTLINSVTNAKIPVGHFAFTTRVPTPAMMPFEDVLIQLVEIPAVFENSTVTTTGRRSMTLVRNTDCILITVDLSNNPVETAKMVIKELYNADIRLNQEKPPVVIERVGGGGIQIFGENKFQEDISVVKEYLKDSKIHNIVIRFEKPTTFQQFVDALDASIVYKKGLIVGTKGDLPGSAEGFEALKKEFGDQFTIVPISALMNKNLDALKKAIYDTLDIIRVYTRSQGGKIADQPLVLKKGATIEDAARKIHKHFVENFKMAIVFRESDKVKRKQVGLAYPLQEGDIIQIYA